MSPSRMADAGKLPFDVDEVFVRLREAVRPFPMATMHQLAIEGFASPFEQLMACIISIRTYEEVSLPTAYRLFARARTPAEMVRLTPEEIDALIEASSFHQPKSRQIWEIARRTVDEHDGELPCDFETLTGFRGVGPKCASLVLGIACNQPRIGVDIHVHRIANRWGYVQASTPERTMTALEAKLPKPYWVEINRLLVPFGKHICTGTLPKCSTCPILEYCHQVGVERHR